MMQFGNWSIDEDGITWTGSPGEYFIHKDRLHESGTEDRSDKYDFLVHLTEKTWLTKSDILDLNEAFLFAFDHYGIGMAKGLSWEATLAEQRILMEFYN